jgi:hypothetical protein
MGVASFSALLCLAIGYGLTIGILWLVSSYAEPNALFGGVVFLVAAMGGLGAAVGFAYLWIDVLGLRGKGPRRGS